MGHAGGAHLPAVPERRALHHRAQVLPGVQQVGVAAAGAAATAGQRQPGLPRLGPAGQWHLSQIGAVWDGGGGG